MTMDRQDTPIRVLVVDDEVSYANVLVKRMRLRGLVAMPAYSGQEAVQALRGGVFDVALLDLKMKNMDGLETLKMFNVIAPEMKVIILTGHGGEVEAKESIRLGAYDYLVKPCDFTTITDRIEKAVQE